MAPGKPTVLFLSAWYPTPLNKSHGIFVRNHALALSRFCKVVVAYAYTSEESETNTITKNTVNENFEEWLLPYSKTRTKIPLLSQLVKLLKFKKAYRTLAGELHENNYNIKAIQLNVIYPTVLAWPAFKKYWPAPHSILEHWTGYLPGDGNYKGLLMKYYTKKAVAGASKIFHVSPQQQKAMQQHGLAGNYELIYNVVDISVFNTAQLKRPQRPLLLHVSGLGQDQKNIRGILKVAAALQKKNYDFDFVFIGGDANIIAQWEEQAKKLHLKNIRFTGHQSPAQISLQMQSASAFVLFSNYENMPVVVLEALACGLPVISSNTGCLETLVDPGFGKLVPVGDEEALAKTIEQVLRTELDFDSQAMSDFIQSRATSTIVGQQLYDHYKALL